ncbi:MAG: hypothetical protein V3W34_05020 [Phycisphaerae bacterium]
MTTLTCFWLIIPPIAADGARDESRGSGCLETEPNDTLATATASGLVDLGTAIVTGAAIGNGPLGEADRDIFSFNVTDEAALPLLLIAAMDAADDEFDGYVRLFTPQGYEIINDDDGVYPDLNPLLQTYIVVPGTYYVAVSHAMNQGFSPTDDRSGRRAPTGDYELAVILSEALAPDSSLEPNEGSPEAGGCTPVDSFPALITDQFIGDGPNPSFDIDCYILTLDGSSIVTVEVTATHLGFFEPRLKDGQFWEQVSNDPAVKRFVRAVLDLQTVRFSITGNTLGCFENDGPCSYGYYDLLVNVTPVESGGGGPYEPNDSLNEATPTELAGPGSATFEAVIGDGVFGQLRGDVDFYELELGLDERLEVTVGPNELFSSFTPVVHLYDYLGAKIKTWIADPTGTVHASFQRRCTDALFPPAAEPETYAVAVMGAGDRVTMDPFVPENETDNPFLPKPMALWAIDGGPGSTGGYEATLAITANPLPPCPTEPNDFIPDVTESVLVDEGEFVCLGAVIGDGPCRTADVDIYRITVNSPPVWLDVRVMGSLCYRSSYAGQIGLFDASGMELASNIETTYRGAVPPAVPADGHLRHLIEHGGEYYVGVSARYTPDYDPFGPCRDEPIFYSGDYNLEVRLIAPEPPEQSTAAAITAEEDRIDRLFATSLDFRSRTIVQVSPETGEVIREFPAPEAPLGGNEGIAYDGQDLFVLGNGARYPFLYRLDPDTGRILERLLTWFGSGYYGGMVELSRVLYIVDALDDAIYMLPASSAFGTEQVKRLDVDRMAGVPMFGALAATAAEDGLLVSDAVDPSIVHRLDPESGWRFDSVNLGVPCPCNADFDKDGDVDDDDFAFFSECKVDYDPTIIRFGCTPADLNCDDLIDDVDTDIFDCRHNGSGNPPNDGCCPGDSPTVAVRATGLATVWPGFIVAGDWVSPELHVFNREGAPRGSIDIDAPVGALAGWTLPAADSDGDHDIDLHDFRLFQICYLPLPAPSLRERCEVFDFDFNGFIDQRDFVVFQKVFTGPMP